VDNDPRELEEEKTTTPLKTIQVIPKGKDLKTTGKPEEEQGQSPSEEKEWEWSSKYSKRVTVHRV